MRRMRPWIAGGVAAVLIGLGFVFPAVAQWRDVGAMTAMSVALLIFGAGLTVAGSGSVVRALRPHGA